MNLPIKLKNLLILLLIFATSSCSNDDDANNPPPNANACTFAGLTYRDTANNTQTFIAEADLTTDYVTAGTNGPEIEVYETANPGNFNFTTTVVDDNTSGTGTINYNGTTYTNVNVTCQRGVTGTTGAVVGDEFRFDITSGGLEFEICVIQDVLTFGYIDADGDLCGSQTVSYTVGVLNNVDIDDNDPNVCM